jgi:hypothetical protein
LWGLASQMCTWASTTGQGPPPTENT